MAKHTKQAFDIHKTLPPASSPTTVKKPATLKPQSIKQPKDKNRSWKRWLATFVVAVFCLILFFGLWDAYELSKASKKMFGSGNLFSLIGGDLASHDGRTNVLIVGYSVDDPGHPGATLTDSIMVMSLRPGHKSGYLLSVPRDLYVKIPGFGYGKINEVYQDGERSNYIEEGRPAGGIGLLEQVIQDKLGVPIDYYALINYSAFRDTVNAVGGISVDINSPDPRGLYDPNISPADGGPLKLANGRQKLDGQTALNLARARGDSYYSYGFPQADFDRTAHQRQMLLALKSKASGWGTILNPLRAGHLFDGMANNVKTDLDTGNVLPLYSAFSKVPDLKSESLRVLEGSNYLTDYGGALIPKAGLNDYSNIQTAIDQLNTQ